MPSYKLIYFDLEGRAELTRYLFLVAKVDYEDNRIPQAEWPEFKKTCEQGKVPILEVDGERIPQSMAIARYLAREFGLYGSNNLEDARIDVVLESVGEALQTVTTAFFEKDAERKAALYKAFKEEGIPKWVDIFTKILEKNQGDYFVGKKVSIADLAFFNLFNDLLPKLGFPDCQASSPKLVAFMDRIRQIPEIAAWIEKRPKGSWI